MCNYLREKVELMFFAESVESLRDKSDMNADSAHPNVASTIRL